MQHSQHNASSICMILLAQSLIKKIWDVYNKSMSKTGEKLGLDLLLHLKHQPQALTLAQGTSTTAGLRLLMPAITEL